MLSEVCARDACGCTTRAVSGKSLSHLGTKVQVTKREPLRVCNGRGCVCCATTVALLFISYELGLDSQEVLFHLHGSYNWKFADWFFHLVVYLKTLKTCRCYHYSQFATSGRVDQDSRDVIVRCK